MSSILFRCGLCAVCCCFVLASCSLDDRPLSYEFHALQAAGASSGGGSGMPAAGAGGRAHGDAGSPPAGADGGADTGHGEAGSPADVGGGAMTGGVSGLGGTGANAGTTGSTAGSGGIAGGGAPSAGAGGTLASSAGSSSGGASGPLFACGDLNHDLVDDCAETLVQNSRFDTSVNPWLAESSLTATWGNVNATGAAGSGSISLSHTGPGGTMIGARQCIPVTPYASYDIAARVQVGAGQTGTAGINVYFYYDDACQGIFDVGNTAIEGGVPGTWTVLGTDVPLWVPGKDHSMYVRLVANKPLNQTTPLTVLIDDVLVAKRVMP